MLIPNSFSTRSAGTLCPLFRRLEFEFIASAKVYRWFSFHLSMVLALSFPPKDTVTRLLSPNPATRGAATQLVKGLAHSCCSDLTIQIGSPASRVVVVR